MQRDSNFDIRSPMIRKSILLRMILSVFLLLNVVVSDASSNSNTWFSWDADKHLTLQVELFYSPTCQHCQKAEAFLDNLEKTTPWIKVKRFNISDDKEALKEFYKQLQQQNSSDFSVPSIMFCNSRWVGFDDLESTGKTLVRALTYCKKRMIDQGKLSPTTIQVLQQWASANQLQLNKELIPSPLFMVFSMAFIDALNPCSIFGFATFLAFLWIFPKQKKFQWVLGISFLLAWAATHYLQQVHSPLYYQLASLMRLPTALMGVGLFLLVLNLSRGEVNRSIWTIIATLLTAVTIYVNQQACLPNLPLIFEQWLREQNLSFPLNVYYQLGYQMVYFVSNLCVLALYFVLTRQKRFALLSQRLNIAGYLILTFISILLMIYPTLLTRLWLSAIVFLGALLGGWIIAKRRVG